MEKIEVEQEHLFFIITKETTAFNYIYGDIYKDKYDFVINRVSKKH